MGLNTNGTRGGDKVGQIVFANEPFADRIGNCEITKPRIKLPNGVTVNGAKGAHVSDFLGVGTLAVAVEHTGDYFNTFIPVTLDINAGGATLTPYTDLTYGAYEYGQMVGRLDGNELGQIAVGKAITTFGLFFEEFEK